MNLRCFFGHSYIIISSNPTNYYQHDESKRPYKHDTVFLFKCTKCKHLKSQRIDGYFSAEYDDRDEDDGDAKKPPILSPDDFYELIGKE